MPWLLLYAVIGLVVPALVIDRVGPLRAVAGRWCCRAGGACVARSSGSPGYVAWGSVRIALGIGTLALIDLAVDGLDDDIAWLIAGAAWALVNTVAYPALACLDAVLHLETRMRTEGLDIVVSRARATGRHATALLGAGSLMRWWNEVVAASARCCRCRRWCWPC